MSECNHDCGSCGESCSERTPGSMLAKLHEGSTVKKVIGVVSGKGGVGKSMVTSQLAVTMQRRGYRTAVLDADITGPSIPKSFGLKEKASGTESAIFPVQTKTGIQVMSINLLLENEEDPVLWRGPIIGSVVTQFWTDVLWDNVDYMFVDMPPGTGDVALSTFQSLPVDGIVIVASPQELVGMVVEKAVRMAEMMNVPILGIVENMSYIVCPDCGKKISLFGESRSQEAAARHGLDLLAEMPIDPKLASLVDAGKIEDFEGDWMTAVADAVEKLPNKVFEK
ncbi:MAG: Mrp/NBP35 family ATP-binding protein [Clostridiales bacterium]|nr:Mrp/NBP35 family ATP-binding protein [bacterium 210917-SL.2.15]MCI5843287.1 Mrp/NBP35 family ATP-binding protein [Clostridiales bacterium]MDY4036828.1 Mrp/NBP35 family ATP-binding protein [Candidatus Pseudoscilispira sp.]